MSLWHSHTTVGNWLTFSEGVGTNRKGGELQSQNPRTLRLPIPDKKEEANQIENAYQPNQMHIKAYDQVNYEK